MSPETRSQAIARLMNVQAANAAQRHALANTTPEPDSVRELGILAYAALRDRRIAEAETLILRLLRRNEEALGHGDAEIPELHEATALVEQPEAWSKRKVVEKTTRPLEDLIHPRKHDEARETVLNVIAAAGVELTGSLEHPDLRNLGKQLGKAKYGRLLVLVAEYEAGARS